MTKKITALLTALCCLSSGGMLASAQYFDSSQDFFTQGREVEMLDNMMGGIVLHTSDTSQSFLVITDGTAITEEDVQGLEHYRDLYVMKWTDVERVSYPDLSIEEGKTVYEVIFSTTNDLPETARKFQLENDFVEEVYFTRSHFYQGCKLGHGVRFELKDQSVTPDPADFPEFKILKDDTTVIDGITLEGRGYWYGTFTDEIMAECNASNAEGSYEAYLFMKEIADRILSENAELFESAVPDLKSIDYAGTENFATQSIWTNAGDPNSDGTVNAADAAEMLVSAAQIGTGVDVAVTSAADVNADGLLNAEDAAAVLSYAAAKGTGADVSWVDILRR